MAKAIAIGPTRPATTTVRRDPKAEGTAGQTSDLQRVHPPVPVVPEHVLPSQRPRRVSHRTAWSPAGRREEMSSAEGQRGVWSPLLIEGEDLSGRTDMSVGLFADYSDAEFTWISAQSTTCSP